MTSLIKDPESITKDGISYRLGTVADATELASLFKEQWKITGQDYFRRELNYDLDDYRRMESLGLLIAGVASDSEGKLIGYTVGFKDSHLFMKDCTIAYINMFLVQEQHRKTNVPKHLLQYTEKLAKEHFNCEYLTIGFIGKAKKVAPKLKWIGYDELEITMIKRLK